MADVRLCEVPRSSATRLRVGKTAIISRYVRDVFKDFRTTIGVDFALKVLKLDDHTVVRLQLWDIAGQERYGRMLRVYFKSAVAAFVVADMCRKASFERTKVWIRDIQEKVHLADGSPIPVILLLNKADMMSEAEIDLSESALDEFCTENGFAAWFLTSAKTGAGINEAALKLVSLILQNEQRSSPNKPIVDPNVVLLTDQLPTPKEERKCCG